MARVDQPLTGGRYRGQWIVVELALRQHRNLVVEKPDQRAQKACLGLASQSQQDEVVAGQDSVGDGGDDGAIVADDPREQIVSLRDPATQVAPQFLLDRLATVSGRLELTQRGRPGAQSRVSSHRSASIAAWQPVPAAVTACR